MEELQEIKLKVAEIKLASMQREFEKANSTYLQTIKTLKAMLSQKTEKQLKLLHELQNLKKEHTQHNQNVQETLQKMRFQQSPSKNPQSSQKSLNNSKPHLHRLKMKQVSLGQKSIDGKSDSASSAQYKQESSTGRQQGFGKIKSNQFINLRRRHELLKQKNNLDGTLQTPKKTVRGSYDVPTRNTKVPSASTKWLRASEKIVRKEDGKQKKW